MLHRIGGPVDYVYFPSSGLVSIVVMMESVRKRRSEQRCTRARCARPAREEPAMMTEVIAILVSVGLVLVTIVSAVLVWRTKQQARQAATRARTEAVNYLREAQSDLKNDRSVTPQAVVSLRKAKNLADVVFSSNRVRSDLNRALQTAEGASQRQRLLHEPNVDSKVIEATRKLVEDLQPIIDQMKREAQLRG
jgi:Asp-tRNA(Asn)/Glu-tRNA(Gln) amidotransferase B subunit